LTDVLIDGTLLKRFQAKWIPVRVKKTRQIKNLEPRFDSIETEKALACVIVRAASGYTEVAIGLALIGIAAVAPDVSAGRVLRRPAMAIVEARRVGKGALAPCPPPIRNTMPWVAS
jgi:hypothetical protein